MKNRDKVATTVKIERPLYNDFKIQGIRSGSNLQEFVEKCVHLYLANEPFRSIVNNFHLLILSTPISSSFGITTP